MEGRVAEKYSSLRYGGECSREVLQSQIWRVGASSREVLQSQIWRVGESNVLRYSSLRYRS
jgi:hypothetical protein